MENALTVSKTRYQRLFESAKDGILILDAETGKITDVNPFLIEMLGYSKEQFIEKAIWEIGLFALVRSKLKRSWAFSNLVSIIRQQLMSYINMYGFLEDPEGSWR